LALESSKERVLQRRIDMQRRLWDARDPSMHPGEKYKTARALFQDIRQYLCQAADDKLLDGGQARVHELLKYEPNKKTGKHVIAVGNVRNFRRDRSLPHFRRTQDHAWFDFLLVLADRARSVEILLYDFELRLPIEGGGCSFIRLDLNPPDHDNEADGLRSHMHINSDDDGMSVPAPVLSPYELLDVMVHGLVPTGRVRREDLAQ
jgi:hypothetical protein